MTYQFLLLIISSQLNIQHRIVRATPDLSSVFSTADLVAPFQAMQAADIALVIDACHSAASVADGRFKPGPMGDSGLGQLAYDKGIRILAATQADDVALEDARLGQGLLTYALAVDGLGTGAADLDGDGRIRIDEWLAYAVRRMPAAMMLVVPTDRTSARPPSVKATRMISETISTTPRCAAGRLGLWKGKGLPAWLNIRPRLRPRLCCG